MSDHIDQLLMEHGITAVWRERIKRGGLAYRRTRTVHLLPVTTENRYFTALHEIGHIVGPRQGGRRLEQERGAWEYALAASVVRKPLPRTMERVARSVLSYERRARRDPRWKLPQDYADFQRWSTSLTQP